LCCRENEEINEKIEENEEIEVEDFNDAKTEKTDSNNDNIPRGAEEITEDLPPEPKDELNDTFELELTNLRPGNLFQEAAANFERSASVKRGTLVAQSPEKIMKENLELEAMTP